jgi:hypothetical protein
VIYRSGEESKLLQLANEIGINFNLEGSPSTEQLLESRQKVLSFTCFTSAKVQILAPEAQAGPRACCRIKNSGLGLLALLAQQYKY